MNPWPQNSIWETASSIENADKEMGTSSLDGTGSPWQSAAQNIRECLRGYRWRSSTAAIRRCFAEDRPRALPQNTPAEGKSDCHPEMSLQEFVTRLLVQLSDAFKSAQ